MEKLNKNSKPCQSGEYPETFNASETASMVKEDVVTFKNSILYEMERKAALEFAEKRAEEKGRARGLEESLHMVAREMKKAGMSVEVIKRFTSLTSEQIAAL